MKLRNLGNKLACSLEDILAEDDDLGLLSNIEPKRKPKVSTSDPAITNFLELVAFTEKNGHEPRKDVPAEKLLATRLSAYRNRADLKAKVVSYDTIGLLSRQHDSPPHLNNEGDQKPEAAHSQVEQTHATSLDDIFAEDDDLNLLGDINTSIFNITHVSSQTTKEIPDEIASRKICEDFFRYQKLFQDVQNVLKTNAVLQRRFSKEETVIIGSMFILRGMLCYVDSIIKEDTSDAERENPRLRIIFENGTETNLLKRSFMRALFKDQHGKYIDFGLNLFSDKSVDITSKDVPTGYIYILNSESSAPELSSLKQAGLLVKIGYSTQDVHERIKNAENEPTYLEAPVKLMASIACYNLNPQKFEHLIHAFLHKHRITMTLIGKNGKPYHPQEWFSVDWQTALEICQRIIDGSIVKYRMDDTTGKVVAK